MRSHSLIVTYDAVHSFTVAYNTVPLALVTYTTRHAKVLLKYVLMYAHNANALANGVASHDYDTDPLPHSD